MKNLYTCKSFADLQVYEVFLPYDYLIKTLTEPHPENCIVGRTDGKVRKIAAFSASVKVLVR